MSDKKKLILTIILFGSIWGGMEAVISASMGGIGTTIPRSVVLAFVALLVLSFARYVLPTKGTTLLIGLVAVGFKFLGLPNLMMCQLAAVAGQAVILEGAFTLAQSRGWLTKPAHISLIVVVSSYVNSLVFSFSQAYIFSNPWWLDRGAGGLLNWSVTTGTAAAVASSGGLLIAALLVKLSFARYEQFVSTRQVAFARIAIAVSAAFWITGLLVTNEAIAGLW
jgi:hypothetical protein